jgi:putative flippase GtrA
MAHFLKFLVVGTIGFIINTVVLVFGVKKGLKASISGPLGAELAILSNFILNNFWTFSDRKAIAVSDYPLKFIQFNILSFGSVIIQFLFLKTGEKIFPPALFKQPFVQAPFFRKQKLLVSLASLPVVNKIAPKFSAYFVFYMFGVGVGLIVNFVIYNQIIWRST